MSHERHSGPNLRVPAHASPYPTSRLAPVHDLVDQAQRVAEADQMLGTVVHAKLSVIADQIRALQEQARTIVEDALRSADLHRAHCGFIKKPGRVYYLYERAPGDLFFSMLSPDEWGEAPHPFRGAFRLEPDLRWTPADQAPTPTTHQLRALIESPGQSDHD